MSIRSILAIAFTIFLIGVLAGSCKKGCGTCKAYGYSPVLQAYTTQICVNNFCTCPNGYEGDSCQIFSINKYIQPSASWLVQDPCSGNPSYYVNMTTSPRNYNFFYINNLFNTGVQAQAQIASSAGNQGVYLNIPSQTVGSITFSGQGYYQNSGGSAKITFNLDYNQSGIDQNCQITMYQQ